MTQEHSRQRVVTSLLTSFMVCALAAIAVGAGPETSRVRSPITVDAEALNKIRWKLPHDKQDRDYLGFSLEGDAVLSEIKAETVVISIFNSYCSVCQQEAPRLNQLHRFIEADQVRKGKIKIIGIGLGNNPLEVETFKRDYHIRFPLFADEKFLLEKVTHGNIRTPSFVVLKIANQNSVRTLDAKMGSMETLQHLLAEPVHVSTSLGEPLL